MGTTSIAYDNLPEGFEVVDDFTGHDELPAGFEVVENSYDELPPGFEIIEPERAAKPEFSFGRLAEQGLRSAGAGIGDVARGLKATEKHLLPEPGAGHEQDPQSPMMQKRAMTRKGFENDPYYQKRMAAVSKLKPIEEYAPKPLEGSSGFAEDVVAGFARFAPSMAATTIEAPLALATTAAQILGAKYDELTTQGVEADRAFDAAAFAALAQTPIEYASNFIQIGRLKNLFGGKGGRLGKLVGLIVKGARDEGIEEILQQPFDEIADVFAKNPDKTPWQMAKMLLADWKGIAKRTGYAGLVGAAGGALLAGGGGAIGAALDGKKEDGTSDVKGAVDKITAPTIVEAEIDETRPGRALRTPEERQAYIESQTVDTSGVDRTDARIKAMQERNQRAMQTTVDDVVEDVAQQLDNDAAQVVDFVDRYIGGAKIGSDEDRQFYANNVAAIEAEISRRVEAGKAKEPWEMTRGEYDRKRIEEIDPEYTFEAVDDLGQSETGSETLGIRDKKKKEIKRTKTATPGTVTHELRHLIDSKNRIAKKIAGLAKKTEGLMARISQYVYSPWRRKYHPAHSFDEYVETLIDGYFKDRDSFSRELPEIANLFDDIGIYKHKGSNKSHREAVAQALKEGKPVPAEVLKDYPDLQAEAVTAAATETGRRAMPGPDPGPTVDKNKQLDEILAIRAAGNQQILTPETADINPDAKVIVPGETTPGMEETGRRAMMQGIDAAANEAATSPENDLAEPTDAQIAAGNYKKGHIENWNGLNITFENPKGSTRTEKKPDDAGDDWKPSWSTEMKNHYGYVRGTKENKDGKLDIFFGDNPESKKVFVIDQVNPETKEFDEPKTMAAFTSEEAAREAYLANYEEGWQGLGEITEMTVDEFKDWALNGDTTSAVKYKKKAKETVGPDGYTDSQLRSVEVETQVTEEETGDIYSMKETAAKALADIDAQIETYLSILECVG